MNKALAHIKTSSKYGGNIVAIHDMYQLDCPCAPWRTFRYTIKNKEKSLYQVRRSGFRKYRQLEGVDNRILYYIGITTIKSTENEKPLANIFIDEKKIETILGDFMLTDVDISQRNYTLKLNDRIVAQVTKKWHMTGDRLTIELSDINEQYQAFIFAVLILIDSTLQTLQSPFTYLHSLHPSISHKKNDC